MAQISHRCHHFPPLVIQPAVWLYLRFMLSYRDVEDLLSERGLDVSYETIPRWVLKFGAAFARGLRQRRAQAKEQANERPMSNLELARRIAFLLELGKRETGTEDA